MRGAKRLGRFPPPSPLRQVLIPPATQVTPLSLKLSRKPPEDWYCRACLALRGGDGGEHGQLLYQLVHERRDCGHRVVALDIGTARGFSAVTMARAMLDADLDGHVYTVDVIDHDEPLDWHAEKHDPDEPLASGPTARSAVWQEWATEEAPRITPITGKSTQVLSEWSHGPIDVAFLDGSHTYDDVKAELEALHGMMADDGVIVLDDVHFGVIVGRVRSRMVSVIAWLVINTLRKVLPKTGMHAARLGVAAEYAVVERRFTGIREAVTRFVEARSRDWSMELIPLPSRGAYQTDDYSLAVLTRGPRRTLA